MRTQIIGGPEAPAENKRSGIIVRSQTEAETKTQLAAINRDPDSVIEVTSFKDESFELYYNDTAIKAIGKFSSFLGGYLDKRNLTPGEKQRVKKALDALADGGRMVCGERQGFNQWNPINWLVSPAYAASDCYIRLADNSRIQLSLETFDECKDAITSYLNSLSQNEHDAVLYSAGVAAAGLGSAPAVTDLVNVWALTTAIDGDDREAYLHGYTEIKLIEEENIKKRWYIWRNQSTTLKEKFRQLAETGVDIPTLLGMAVLGGSRLGKGSGFKTAQAATAAAKKLGYTKTNYFSQGQPVYRKGNKYITPDQTGHIGGVWKSANSVNALLKKNTRSGTYDANLNRIGD